MGRFIIEGGRPLKGKVRPSGNKNEALPALVACLLTSKPVTLHNVPKIGDVLTVCEIMRKLGAQVEWIGGSSVEICAEKLTSHEPDPVLCTKVRASILFLGPLLSRLKKMRLALPGGDVIGARKIDTHWEGAIALGANFSMGAHIEATADSLVGTDIYMDEPSVTATENLLMLAATAKGTTVLHNAASEPHVVGICNLLIALGAKIEGGGTNRISIHGVSGLGGGEHTIKPDFMEVGSFLCLASCTESSIEIEGVSFEDYRFILKTLKRIGIDPQQKGDSFIIERKDKTPQMQRDLSGRVGTIYSGPWPAYPTDLMSVAIVAATQAQGTMIFFEKMFEGRMFFTDKLMQMGASIVLCDPHRVVVNGPAQLYGAHMSSPDVRAGMSLVIAGLAAKGKSSIDNIYQIERGYCNIAEKLVCIGAALTREE